MDTSATACSFLIEAMTGSGRAKTQRDDGQVARHGMDFERHSAYIPGNPGSPTL
jgi:hypothetical protein